MPKQWFDEHFLLHPGPQPERSVNGLQYTGQWILAQGCPLELRQSWVEAVHAHKKEKGVWWQTPWTDSDVASHDIVTVIVTLSRAYGLDHHKDVKILPLFWHPRDVIYYAYMRRNWYDCWCYLALPLLWLIMFQSCFKKYKYRDANNNWMKEALSEFGFKFKTIRSMISTDGKILSWVRCTDKKSFKWVWKICSKLIARHFEDKKAPRNLFKHYFPREDHPMNVILK